MRLKLNGIVLVCCCFTVAVASPVVLDGFEDNWEYAVEPFREAVLEETQGNHTLPPVQTQRNAQTSEKPQWGFKLRTGKKLANAAKSRIPCSACKLGVGLIQRAIQKGDSFQDIKEKFVGICVALKIEPEDVCAGIFDVYGPDVLPVLNLTTLEPSEVCALCVGESCGDVDNPLHEWRVELPQKNKPPPGKVPLRTPGAPTFKVLQISDTHFDPDYVEGSPSVCEEPLCCRSNSTPKKKLDASETAGRWGSYGSCDAPYSLIKNILHNIAQEHPDIDYVIWTGDLPPHDIWNQTKVSNLDIIRETADLVFEAFPNVPVFPALGNHESIPPGSFAPPWMRHEDHSIDWLYEEISELWGKWLPAPLNNTITHGGFYSVLIRPGFRLISLNMNYCHTISWWLLLNSTDPAKELQWLVYELQQAEDNGEVVHIIGHIPPGSPDCMKVWSRNYYAIVERYENTIAAQFFGHTHADEFEVFYDTQEFRRPTSVAYIGPSVTTYEDFNPAYRIYYVDGDYENSTKEVVDHETWTVDLEAANRGVGEPRWFRLYSAKQAYGLESLRAAEWGKLVERLVDEPDLFEDFYRYYYRDSPKRPDCKTAKCVLGILCDLKSGRSHDRHNLCRELELIF